MCRIRLLHFVQKFLRNGNSLVIKVSILSKENKKVARILHPFQWIEFIANTRPSKARLTLTISLSIVIDKYNLVKPGGLGQCRLLGTNGIYFKFNCLRPLLGNGRTDYHKWVTNICPNGVCLLLLWM